MASLAYGTCSGCAGRVYSALGPTVFTNLSERRKRDELLAAGNLARSILNNAGDGIAVCDSTGTIIMANPELERLCGFDPKLQQFDKVLPLTIGTGEQRFSILDVLTGTEHRRSEVRLSAQDGTDTWLLLSSAPIGSPSEDPGCVLTLTDITDRKRAEQVIAEHGEWLRTTLTSIGDAVLTCNGMGQVTFLNPVAEELTGWKSEEATGQHVSQVFRIVNEQTGQPAEDIAGRVLVEHRRHELADNTALLARDGRRIPIEDSAAPIVGSSGEMLGVVLTFYDVTERRRREQEIAKLNRTLRALNNSTQALLRASDEERLLQHVCRVVTQDCGYKMVWIGFAEDDEAKSVRPVAYSGFDEGYLEAMQITWGEGPRGQGPTGRAIRTGQPCSCRNMLTDPTFAPWRDEAIRRGYASSLVLPLVSEGKAFGALTVYSHQADPFSEDEVRLMGELANDLAYGIRTLRLRAAHAQAEEALRRSEARFRAFFETAAVGAVQIDMRGNFELVNQRFCEFTGYDRDEILRMNISDLWPPDERAEDDAEFQRWIGDMSRPFQAERRHVRKDGRIIWVHITASAIRDTENRATRISAVIEDITDRRNAEEALIRSEKLASVGRMAATIAHEINNPLAAVMNALFLAGATERLPHSSRKYLQMADDELRRVAHLTRQALGFYQESSAPMAVSAAEIMDSAISLLHGRFESKHVVIRKRYTERLKCFAIGGEIRQVFTNVLSNSLDAIGDGGAIAIHISDTRSPEGDPSIRVTVADNGKGIKEESRGHVFEPFFTTKQDVGTGLGLWVSKQIVEKHGGSIHLRSKISGSHRGTTVVLLLPSAGRL